MKGHPHNTVRVAGSGIAHGAPKELEDAFPGRWDPKRGMQRDVRPLVHAVGEALAHAGWWTPGSGAQVSGGLVVGCDYHSLGAACRFGRALRVASPRGVAPSDFLFALPSSAAATVGSALGLVEYQATLVEGGLSGFAALDHATQLVRLGRIGRLVVAALTVVDHQALALLGGAPADTVHDRAFALAVAWCLEAGGGPASRNELWVERTSSGGPGARAALAQDPGPHRHTRELLADLPGAFRQLAAPSLYAATRFGDDVTERGATLLHGGACDEDVALITLRRRPTPGTCPG